MRVLLIDNHDSFTAILGHYLWTLAGERPMLFRNDGLLRDELQSLDFDAAVLSPGPGHPANVRDFGVCRDLLELFPDKPVLGVCLGMQGMAHLAGARVVPLAGALHGRPSRISHDGDGIFRGLPPEFRAVRYHSLVVEESSLPQGVRVAARSADDGQVMGVSFADRPWFGVQFHPESVGTEHGMELLGNFLDIAMPGRVRPDAMARAGTRESLDPDQDTPVVPHVELSWREPAEVFARFLKSAPLAFWLDGEHARPDSGWPSTVMGRAERRHALCNRSILEGDLEGWSQTPLAGDPSASSFRRSLGAARPARRSPWPGYRGGPVGQFDYEWKANAPFSPPWTRIDYDRSEAEWMLPEGWLVFDHAARKAYAAWEEREPPAWLREVIDAWDAPWRSGGAEGLRPHRPAGFGTRGLLPPFAEWKPRLSEADHAEGVGELQDAIARGETYEACLTLAFEAWADADPLDVFLSLRKRNPAPYGAYLVFPEARILSASPELFLEGTSDGVLRSRPIKGTRRRGEDPGSDRALRDELARSEKDAAENRMITDLTRSDLARVCRPGSVEVPSFLGIEEHPAVFQMVSEVRGRMVGGMDAWDAIAACFPGGSMTGAPKERTMEILEKAEAGPRGTYSGALGYLTDGGAFTLSMVIRTVVNRGLDWSVGCGGAVLADSDAAAEWREAVVKARSVIDAVSGPAPG